MDHLLAELPRVAPGAAALALAFGAVRWRRGRDARPLHPLVAQYTEVARWHRPLAATASELGAVGDEATLRALMDALERVRALVEAGGADRTAQWKISELLTEAGQHADALAGTGACASTEQMRQTAYAQTELAPLLKKHLDDALLNHLLERS